MAIRSASASAARARSMIRALGLSLAFCLIGGLSAAQTPPTGPVLGAGSRPERPYRGLFGAPAGESEQRWTVDGSFGTAWIKRSALDDKGLLDPQVGPGGAGGGAGSGSTDVLYSLNRARVGFNVTNVFSADYYPQFPQNRVQTRELLSGAVYFVPFERTHITVSQGFKNLPEFSYADLIDPAIADVVPLNQPLGVMTVDRFHRYGLSVDVSQKLSNRTRADVTFGYGRGMITSGKKWTTRLFQGNLNHRIARGVSAFAGYGYGEQRYQDLVVRDVRDSHPSITFGVDYNKALSISRRTTLSFSTGISEIRDQVHHLTTYHLIGGASLRREFGRTWDTALIYSRNVRYIDAFAVPLLNDSLGVVLRGSFSRRVQLKSGVSTSSGQLGGAGGHSFDTSYGAAQLSFAITRYLALGTDYSYYRVPSVRGTLPIEASGSLNGQSVRASVMLHVPLISQAKR